MRISDWSSDVCSSDLHGTGGSSGTWSAARFLYLSTFEVDRFQEKGLPPPIRPPRPPRSIPFFPIFCTRFMMRLASLCCFSSLFTSCTVVPEPAAMRCLRDALMRRSEEHTSELQSLMRISYAVFCL